MIDRSVVPNWKALFWPTLKAIEALGGSGSVQEIERKVADLIRATNEQQSVLHRDGPYSELNYRMAWCRTYLKGVGYLNTTGRGIWSITEDGRRATERDVETVESRYRELHPRKPHDQRQGSEELGETPETPSERTWRDDLLERLKDMPPDRFEHLAKRLLREAGFVQVEVTRRSGDEGIDGSGIYRPSLVSFPVYLQCKRYRGSVGPDKVRDFRGAMVGRGDQGLLITTGTFTSDAKAEASRPGAPLIDLIDGDGLCTLLKDYRLGLRVSIRTVEDVEVISEFFAEI